MPKLKFTKEVIVDAAYDILKEEGFESISARKIAKKLNCSTAPIYFNFETVEKVKEEVINLCEKKLNNYLYGNYSQRQILNASIGFVIFAREEGELFKTIFLNITERFKKLYKETLDYLLTQESLLLSFPNLTFEEGKEIINKLWYFIFGYATLVCTSFSNEEKKNETNKVIEEKIIGMSKYFKMENFK